MDGYAIPKSSQARVCRILERRARKTPSDIKQTSMPELISIHGITQEAIASLSQFFAIRGAHAGFPVNSTR